MTTDEILTHINTTILKSYLGTIPDKKAESDLLEHCHQLHELTKDDILIIYIMENTIKDFSLYGYDELENDETLEALFDRVPGAEILKLDLNEAIISYME